MNEIVIPATARSPELHVQVNPLYSLYHYLRIEAAGPLSSISPETAEATHAMRATINQQTVAGVANMGGYHGLWDLWEPAIAQGATTEAVANGLRKQVDGFADGVSRAMSLSEPFFVEHLWPERLPHIERALDTLRERFVPHFSTMARHQAEQMDIVWPDRVDVHLVAWCYDRFEATPRRSPLTSAGAPDWNCARRSFTKRPMSPTAIRMRSVTWASKTAFCSPCSIARYRRSGRSSMRATP